HFKEDYFLSDFDKVFKEKELKTNNSPFLLGYYAHLILDKVWSNSAFVGKTLNNHEMEKIYQISRFLYSHNDLEKFLKSISNQKIIDNLINYKLESHKLPSIYNSFDIDLLNDVFSEIVDYALEKKFFEKLENTKDYYIYKNGKIEIQNNDF
ncbi:MAG: hypothetical protein PHN31_03155, partial [Candidatus Gracilibacteria bacterium]|nr:hypothetical protein [Candidatus Gracilibacteria bacterium]